MEINPDECNSDEMGGIILDGVSPRRLIRRIIISPSFFAAEADDLRNLVKRISPGVNVELSKAKRN
jgi:hypothetical protein